MRIFGNEIKPPEPSVLVLPRQAGDIVIKARAITGDDLERFDRICPEPAPPTILRRGQTTPTVDLEDKGYAQKRFEHGMKKLDYVVIVSLVEVEFDTVSVDDPDTFKNWRTDFQAAGFTIGEIGRIYDFVMQTQCLDQSKVEEATRRFLLGQGRA